MGLFSDIVGGIGKFVGGFLGVPARPAPTPAAPAPSVQQIAQTTPGIGGLTALALGPVGVAARFGQQAARGLAGLIVPSPQQVQQERLAATGGLPLQIGGALGRGNGRFVKQTTVSTIDLVTGQVVRQVALDGAPFLMNKEVRALASVAKKVRKANAKIPSKTRKASALSELRDATVQQALLSVRATAPRALCPPG